MGGSEKGGSAAAKGLTVQYNVVVMVLLPVSDSPGLP